MCTECWGYIEGTAGIKYPAPSHLNLPANKSAFILKRLARSAVNCGR